MNSPAEAARGGGTITPERLVMFSDAVFAIAITILALELRAPTDAHGDALGPRLIGYWPKLLAFLISFAVIALYWIGHARLFRWVARTDGTLVTLNLMLLAVVSFLPFPTAVLGDAPGNLAAVVLYAATVALLGLLLAAMWCCAGWRRRLLEAGTPRQVVAQGVLRGLVPPVVMLVSLAVARRDPLLAMYCWAGMVPLMALTRLIRPAG